MNHVQGTEEKVISSEAEAEVVAKIGFPEKVMPTVCLNTNESPLVLKGGMSTTDVKNKRAC